ncbi:MAG TPA: bifunctional 5,10-methylenetetrahydrofolate dehydrogenase/5,10-methenyltetrahydrofolate cyclohydrolase [Patescibacteria group bacterium]|nr:bifunctional 5,10-methylenetetrahydrofolate dehydrogenase/5,10-methenyltetrahydrofolate cyclohydrolase [Patescibacteria group bacterium]
MVNLIDGTKIAKRVKDKIAQEVYKRKELRPNLAILLVGEREDSKLYVSLKEREGKKIGIDTHLYKLSAETSEKELLDVIDFLNKDKDIDGVLIQLPLPKKFNTDKIINALDPKKDVDGFHPQKPEYIVSPVIASVGACLDKTKMVGEGKKACSLHHSEVFGKGLIEMLKKRGFTMVSKKDSDKADLLITALGEPETIKKEMIKEGAVIIDIGIFKKDNKVLGDVDFNDIKNKASYITPVPGGIGPMTIAFLFKNVFEIFKRDKK